MGKQSKQGHIDFGGFIQCTSKHVEALKKGDNNAKEIIEGALYFVLDTKQILLGKTVESQDADGNSIIKKDLIPMGSGTGVRFAKKKTDLNNLNKDIVFYLEDLEDQSCYPQVDDLIFNQDGCFYRVRSINNIYINAERLTVAGSGGGGGGGGSSSGGGTSVQPNFYSGGLIGTVPPYIIIGDKDNVDYPLSHVITASLNNAPLQKIKQTVKICVGDSGEEVEFAKTFTITPGSEPNIIPLKNEWFTKGGRKSIVVSYTYSTSNPYVVPLGDTLVFDLSINQSLFKENTVIKDSYFNFNGKITKIEGENDVSQKVYIKIMRNGIEDTSCYPITGLIVDGTERYLIPDASGSFAPKFENLKYGEYTIEFYQKLDYQGETFDGPKYTYDFLCLNTNNINDAPKLLCNFSGVENRTFLNTDIITVPTLIYDPYEIIKNKAKAGLIEYGYINKLNNEERVLSVQGFALDFGEQRAVTFRKMPVGEYNIFIRYKYKRENETEKVIVLTCSVKINESANSKSGPIVSLNTTGRSNSESSESKIVWENESLSSVASDFSTTFNNFTWISETRDSNRMGGTGWCDNNGESVLRVGQDAYVQINYDPYALDYSATGKGLTLIFDYMVRAYSTRHDYNNPILQCFNPTGSGYGFKVFGDCVYFKSIEDEIKLTTPENVKINVAITITPLEKHKNSDGVDVEQGLVSIYLNGILSYARVYKTALKNSSGTIFKIGNDNYTNEYFTSNDSIIDIYAIDIYDRDLTAREVVDQYIEKNQQAQNADELIQKNNIYKDGTISYELMRDNGRIPTMIITGALPSNKQDKTKRVGIEFWNPEKPEYNFSQSDVQIEVQGTSSQYYPVKNWKLKKLKPGGADGYVLDTNQVETSTFCLKADYAESTSVHNTQNANLVENLYDAIGVTQTPAQMFYDENCRTTIYGYPIVVFHRATENDPPSFLGKYNFNFDKGSKEVFGFGKKRKDTKEVLQGECWEFKDNDAIAGMVPGGRETTGFAWDKWQVTYVSSYNADPKRIYLPEDDDLDRGWDEERHTNVDAVRIKAKNYLQEKKSYALEQLKSNLSLTDSEKADLEWWSRANLEEGTMLPMWCKYFEPRYCDKKIVDEDGNVVTYKTGAKEYVGDDDQGKPIYEDEEEEVCDISQFAELYDWIMSTAINADDDADTQAAKLEEFSNNIFNKFDKDYLLFYYVYTFFAMMVDQRAKNMFFAYWEPIPQLDETGAQKTDKDGNLLWYGGKWQPWFYDNDTSFGINNSGFEIVMSDGSTAYYAEDDRQDAAQKVFQGDESVLWTNLKLTKSSDIKTMYRDLRNSDLDLNLLEKYFVKPTESWSASVYNEDSYRKYVAYAYAGFSYTDVNNVEENEDVIQKLRGDGVLHFSKFMKDRIDYCDRKWDYSKDVSKNALRLRPNTDKYVNDVLSLEFIPFSTGRYPFYLGADNSTTTGKNAYEAKRVEEYDKNEVGMQRMYAGKKYPELYSFDGSTEGNVAYFLNPSDIVFFGDTSKAQWSELQYFDKSFKLRSLLIGNKDEILDSTKPDISNYNSYLAEFALGSPVLETIDISNTKYANKGKNLKLTSCPNIRNVYARNSQILGIDFPSGGYLQNLILPDTLSMFEISKQLLLEEQNVIFENIDISGSDQNPYRNLTVIKIEDCHQFNSRAFLTKCLNNNCIPDNGNQTKNIRVTGIDYVKDENGMPKPIVTREYNIDDLITVEEYNNTIQLFITDEQKNSFDKCLDKTTTPYKVIRKIREVPVQYSPWVFLNQAEFEEFANLFKNSPFTLKGKNDLGDEVDKPWLQGSCYIIGGLDGNKKDVLRNSVLGDFKVSSNASKTKYKIYFYRLDPNPNIEDEDKRQPILGKDGNHYFQEVYEGEYVKNPYTSSTLVNNWLDDESITSNGFNYVIEEEYDGIDYVHNFDKQRWVLYSKSSDDDIPTEDYLASKATSNIPKTLIDKNYDVYAVYTKVTPMHDVRFWKKLDDPDNPEGIYEIEGLAALEENDTGILHNEDYNRPLPGRGGIPYWDESVLDDWEFSGRWDPEPVNVREDMNCVAIYDYIALQTCKILDKTIQSFQADIIEVNGNEKRITTIPAYAFLNCTKLETVTLNVPAVIELENINAFDNTPIATSATKGYIYVPYGYKGRYIEKDNWKVFADKIKELKEE